MKSQATPETNKKLTLIGWCSIYHTFIILVH